MQTFLPYPDFAECARVLDRQRLGKQRVETMQIMKALTTGDGWVNHPATRMWDGYRPALMRYQIAICTEWTDRGYRDTCLEKTALVLNRRAPEIALTASIDNNVVPPWLGDPDFHASHRSNLLRKAPDHYRAFWPDEPDDLEYVWPVAGHSARDMVPGNYVRTWEIVE